MVRGSRVMISLEISEAPINILDELVHENIGNINNNVVVGNSNNPIHRV